MPCWRLALILFLCNPGPAADPSPSDQLLLPANHAVPGWVRSGKALGFPGSNLYGRINGGSELFLEFGFEMLTVADYRSGEEEISLELYRMSDPEAALGIYLSKKGKETPDLAWPVRHTRSRFQLLGVQGSFYFQINNLEGEETGEQAMMALGRLLAARLPASGRWEIPGWFPREGLDLESLRLIRGPYSLESIFTFGEGNILQLGRERTALAGRFSLPGGGSATRILAPYPDEATARTTFQFLRGHLDSSLRLLSEKPGAFLFQDYADKFGLVRLEGSLISIQVNLTAQPTM